MRDPAFCHVLLWYVPLRRGKIFQRLLYLPGVTPLVLFEGTDKIAQIIKAIPIGNLRDGIIGGSQLAAGLLDPLAVEVIHWCLMRHLGKEPAEIFRETWKPKRIAPAG